MTDYIHSEGADASNYSSADYANNFFTYAVDGLHEAYYITRFASAIDHASATLTNNSVSVDGTTGGDQINVNVLVSATEGASAYSYGNSPVRRRGRAGCRPPFADRGYGR